MLGYIIYIYIYIYYYYFFFFSFIILFFIFFQIFAAAGWVPRLGGLVGPDRRPAAEKIEEKYRVERLDGCPCQSQFDVHFDLDLTSVSAST